MCELSCLYSLNKLSVSSKTLRTHHKLQPFINNLFLPGFKYRGRIKKARGKKRIQEIRKAKRQKKKSTKRREKGEVENAQRKREKRTVKTEIYDTTSSE